ncbi:MAG: S8 family serine peptidase [Planctomycetes bacterium]|nr:S8 family serine peptidase [Planctomycetota bacterium]
MLHLLSLTVLALPQQPPVLAERQRHFPESGITVHEQRVLDLATGRVRRLAGDAAGVPVDPVVLARRALERRDAQNGKLHPSLVDKLAVAGEHEVAVWLRRPAAMPDLRGLLDEARRRGATAEDARRAAMAAAGAAVRSGNDAFAAAARAAGATVVHVDTITPVVFVRGDAATIRALALRADVDLAYWSSPTWQDEVADAAVAPEATVRAWNEWASRTARTDAVHRRGIDGAGVKVMVNDTAQVVSGNPFLPPVVNGNGASVAAHATAVAGILASRQVPNTGAAPGLTQVYSYGGSGDVVAPQAWAWGMGQGISFGNCSWWNGQKGQIQFLDRYFDYIIRHFAVMLFKSAGNQGGGDGKITTPGCGYNMTASGNATEQNNLDWTGDAMSSSSSWVNPLEGHDKPEVTACGTTITTTTTASPWIGAQGSGTSYASPVTCGVAALLAQTNPALQAQPEAVRALLMAGAFHNIEGAAVLSDRDGSGHIDAAASQSALARGQLHTATLTPASFVGGVYEVIVPLVQNDETRICGVWFSLADSSYATEVLQMDLDLTVWYGTTLVASSASIANPFEIVQFVPPATGNYTVRLQNQQFLGASEPFALAWVTRRNCATNEVILGGNQVPGGIATFEFVDPYHPGAPFLAALSVSGPPSTVPVGPRHVFDFGGDIATVWSLSLPGFAGTYGANGRANASVVLPDIPWLSGWPVYCAVLTWDATAPAEVEETSPVATFVIQ